MRKSKSIGIVFAAILVLLGVSLFVSCRAKGASAKDAVLIKIGSLYEPSNLSNVDASGQGSVEALSGNVYEALFRLNDNGVVENLLAENYSKSSDGLKWTIKLRNGVKFHSGKLLTSDDVKKSYQRVMAEDSLASRKSSYKIIQSIETPSADTVVFNLDSPSISFPYILSYAWIVNTDAPDLKTAEDGTGPYTLDKWTRGSSISIKKWDEYWGEKAKNDGAVFNYFTDANALSNALLSGGLDIITSVQSPDSISSFSDTTKYVVNNGASTTKEILAFNDKVKPFNDISVRKAIYSAIDRQKLLNSIWGNYGTLIGSMVPPTDPWYDPALANANPYDLELSNSLLKGAGYADGFTFTLDTPTYDPHPIVAQFIQSELAKVGITVNINPISGDEWYSKVFKAHDFEATLQEHVNDRDVVWYGNPDFYWGYKNDKVIALISGAESAESDADFTAALLEVNRTIASEAASVWLYLYPQIVVASASLQGYPVNGLNSQFYVYNIVKR
ncbi:MAG: ABC transporter substrate-binding protein [Termitinemataceae bacterium]|nr:MAG: ABC transporter substrate-binding protein [Termitinemataceae bacterium]